MTASSSSSKIILGFIAALAWFSLITQFVLMVQTSTLPLPETILHFFTYFTVLTNTLVAVYACLLIFNPASKAGQFAARPSVGTAVTVYIVAVGVIFNAILRSLWNDTGMQRLVNELLHTLIPFLFLMYWVLFLAKKELAWNAFLPWLIYPFVYCLYILGSGHYTGFYPYPFMDVAKLGIQQVVLNCISVTTVFLGFSVLFVNIGRLKSGKK